MAPKSKLILIMATLSLRKKKICAKVENEDTGRRFLVRKIFQERKKYGLYHILTDELRLFDKEYFFRFVRMTPQRFKHFFYFWREEISVETNCSRIGRNFRRMFIQIYFTS